MSRRVGQVGSIKHLDCGCLVDDIQYHEMCHAHRSEFDETHARWNQDHEDQRLLLAEERR